MARQNLSFLHDLLQTIGNRVRLRSGNDLSGSPAYPRLIDACQRLIQGSGEFSRISVSQQALDAYAQLTEQERLSFFRVLLNDYSADTDAVRAAYARWETENSEFALAELVKVVEPQRQALFRHLNFAPGGTLQLVRMRDQLLQCIRSHPELAPLDADFSHLLASWFNLGFLVMRRIDWDTPASILEKIVAYEAVHKIRSWDDLRRRLNPVDRRCYGFFHPATGDEPLIFVEVALCEEMPSAIAPLLEAPFDQDESRLSTAVFYSISNCQPGLKGISFGNFLIKQVVADLSKDLPQLRHYVTLSPVPGFAAWLARQETEEIRALRISLSEGSWQSDTQVQDQLAPLLKRCAAQYIVEAKNDHGDPVDPVTRFHIGNGASAHRLNWPGDFAPGAVQRAHGLMINYLYELEGIEARHEEFAKSGTIACGPDVERLLQRQRPSIQFPLNPKAPREAS